MPPRKSTASVASNGPDDGTEAAPSKAVKDGISVEDLSLPRSMVARLAKGVLPANTQIQKDALLALHKSATVFVSYIAANSSEIAQAGGKKTIQPHDVVAALKDAEYEDFLPRLEAELTKYNEIQCDKRNNYRRKVKEDKAAATVKDGSEPDAAAAEQNGIAETANGAVEAAGSGHEDDERPFKKFKGPDAGARDVATEGDVLAAEGLADDEADGEQDDDGDEMAGDDVDVEDEVEDDEYDVPDDGPLEDLGEEEVEVADRSGLRDEALDEPESD